MDVRPPSPYSDPTPGYVPSPPHGYPSQPAATAGPATYRPSMPLVMATWRRGLWASALVVGLVLGVRLLYGFERGGFVGLLTTAVLFVGLFALTLGTWLLYLRTLSLTVDEEGVVRRVFGLSRRIPRAVLQRVVLCSYTQQSRFTSREVPLVALLDAAGRSRLTLNLSVWAESDAQALVGRLGLMGQVSQIGHRGMRQLRREIPGALPWTVAHRALTFLIVLGVTLVVVAAIVAVLVATS